MSSQYLFKPISDLVKKIVNKMRPNLQQSIWDKKYLIEREILTSSNDTDEIINHYIFEKIEGLTK